MPARRIDPVAVISCAGSEFPYMRSERLFSGARVQETLQVFRASIRAHKRNVFRGRRVSSRPPELVRFCVVAHWRSCVRSRRSCRDRVAQWPARSKTEAYRPRLRKFVRSGHDDSSRRASRGRAPDDTAAPGCRSGDVQRSRDDGEGVSGRRRDGQHVPGRVRVELRRVQ